MHVAKSFTFIAITMVSLSGCQNATTTETGAQSSESSQTNAQLVALGKAYHSFHLTNKKGPASWDEAISSGDSAAISALRDQGCLVVWGIRFRDATVGASNFVLAYPPATLEKGGPVLLLDGSVLQAKPEPLKELLESQAEIGVPE